MAIPRKQIGWSQESNLLWEISRQMEKLTGVVSTSGGGGGNGVQSVTGLNTDNTNPLTPIVQLVVDGTTIQGAGTIASPLAITTALPVIDMNVDLGGGDFDLAGAGIYRILAFGNYFIFNDTGILDGSRVIVTNGQALQTARALIVGAAGISVKYQGTGVDVTEIPSGMTYEFVYFASGTTWYCLNPTPQICPPRINLDALGNNYDILTPGCFQFYNNTTGYDIQLPDPTAFNGLQIVIWNKTGNALGYAAGGGFQPVIPSGTTRTSMPADSVDTLISIESQWVCVNNF